MRGLSFVCSLTACAMSAALSTSPNNGNRWVWIGLCALNALGVWLDIVRQSRE